MKTLGYHPNPEIESEIAIDAADATDYNRSVGFDDCPLCEMGWPRVPSNAHPTAKIHNAVGGHRRVVCARGKQ
jgi:hypothetical protein